MVWQVVSFCSSPLFLQEVLSSLRHKKDKNVQCGVHAGVSVQDKEMSSISVFRVKQHTALAQINLHILHVNEAACRELAVKTFSVLYLHYRHSQRAAGGHSGLL